MIGLYFNLVPVVRRDRLVVRTLRCGRSNPGSNPGHGTFFSFFILYSIFLITIFYYYLSTLVSITIRIKDVSVN